MKIKNHRLYTTDGEQVPYESSPNRGGELTPRYLVLHYTAGRSARQSINWLTSPHARASAHLVIGRDGQITQLVPFNREAWHAGRSEWNGLEGMNHHSIGIELDNAGKLELTSAGWRAWFGEIYPDEEVLEAVHKHGTEPAGWHVFPEEQLAAAIRAAIAIVEKYDLLDVVGHDDISPGRKADPGPAFPMGSFRSMVMGRREDLPPRYATTANLNIRIGPGVDYPTLPFSPLRKGAEVEILYTDNLWKYVDVLEEMEGQGCGLRGWVSGRYLRLVEA